MLYALERNRHMNWTELSDRQGSRSMGRNAERALRTGTLLKVEMEMDGLSKCQAKNQEEAEQNSSSSCGHALSAPVAQI